MIKKLALGCLLIVALVGVVFYAAWRQATRLPDWYAEPGYGTAGLPAPEEGAGGLAAGPPQAAGGEPAANLRDTGHRGDAAGSEPRAAAPSSPEPRSETGGPAAAVQSPAPAARASRPAPAAAPPRAGRVELGERELNELLARSLDEHPRGQRLKRAVKGMRASIDGDRLELGVVTSLAALGAAAESEREARAVDRLARLAPWLGDRDVYLALRGRPRARDGRLVFDRDGELRVGGITFDAADLATRLGVPEDKLDRGVELPIPGMTIEDVEVADGSLVLSLVDR